MLQTSSNVPMQKKQLAGIDLDGDSDSGPHQSAGRDANKGDDKGDKESGKDTASEQKSATQAQPSVNLPNAEARYVTGMHDHGFSSDKEISLFGPRARKYEAV
jgi:hypothetical protein